MIKSKIVVLTRREKTDVSVNWMLQVVIEALLNKRERKLTLLNFGVWFGFCRICLCWELVEEANQRGPNSHPVIEAEHHVMQSGVP
jgi:hypothetical protein